MLLYRDYLRGLWRMDPEAIRADNLDLLLGTANTLQALQTPGVQIADENLRRAWETILRDHPKAFVPLRPAVSAVWGTGDFSYVPRNQFQLAVYLLFRESWRAKLCLRCSQYFLARKPPQLYCAAACSAATKRERALNWWRQIGATRRARRTKTRHRK